MSYSTSQCLMGWSTLIVLVALMMVSRTRAPGFGQHGGEAIGKFDVVHFFSPFDAKQRPAAASRGPRERWNWRGRRVVSGDPAARRRLLGRRRKLGRTIPSGAEKG